MLKSVSRLEQALRRWEDTCLFHHSLVELAIGVPGQVNISSPSGLSRQELQRLNVSAFANFKSLRKYLLRSVHDTRPFDFEKYASNERVRELLGSYAWLPMNLWAWTRESRRVYHLSRELQLLLSMTSLNGVTWGEVKLPFDAFAISLQDPLVDEASGESYDLILVSKVTKHNTQTGHTWTDLEFTLFPTKLEQRNSIQLQERERVEDMMRRRNWSALANWAGRFHRRFGSSSTLLGITFSFSKNQDAPIIDERWTTSNDTPEWSKPQNQSNGVVVGIKAARLVAGLALYFKSLPPNHSYVREESPRERIERVSSYDKTCIAKEAHVCVVSSCFKLTREERELLAACGSGAGGWELRVHFRSGFWHRPIGLGQDPTAAKSKWTRPTLVRRDRVEPGTVPGGAEHQL